MNPRMCAPIVVQVDGFLLQSDGDGEPRIRDIDLAERLGYDRPRKIRDLIGRMIETGEILDVHVRPTVGRIPESLENAPGRPATEYWLDEEQTLLVCMRSDAPKAMAVNPGAIFGRPGNRGHRSGRKSPRGASPWRR
jgi:hypothetical protein